MKKIFLMLMFALLGMMFSACTHAPPDTAGYEQASTWEEAPDAGAEPAPEQDGERQVIHCYYEHDEFWDCYECNTLAVKTCCYDPDGCTICTTNDRGACKGL